MFYLLRERDELAYVPPFEGEGERRSGVCSTF